MRFAEKTAVFWWGGKKRHDLRPLNSLVLIIPTSCNGGIFLRELVGLIIVYTPYRLFLQDSLSRYPLSWQS